MPVPLLSIPTVAKQSGTSVLAVRQAVDHGLIDGYRTDTGVRACPPQAVAQMALLKTSADGQGGDGSR